MSALPPDVVLGKGGYLLGSLFSTVVAAAGGTFASSVSGKTHIVVGHAQSKETIKQLGMNPLKRAAGVPLRVMNLVDFAKEFGLLPALYKIAFSWSGLNLGPAGNLIGAAESEDGSDDESDSESDVKDEGFKFEGGVKKEKKGVLKGGGGAKKKAARRKAGPPPPEEDEGAALPPPVVEAQLAVPEGAPTGAPDA